MKRTLHSFYICLLFALCTASCIEPYNPPAIAEAENYLVVEGFINSGTEPSTFYLSRTRTQADTNNLIPEIGATVYVEGEQGDRYDFSEQNDGQYNSVPLNLTFNARYRLHIRTRTNKEYISDYVALKATPAIDTLTWAVMNDGIQIYVDTHDPENDTRYYRWDYEETWQYNSAYYSNFEFVSKDSSMATREDQIFICYKSEKSSEILINSSVRLAQDVIYRNPIIFTPALSGKLTYKYSVLVKQYALSQDAFNYWQILQKNTESTGSIFDAQPSQLKGNITCVTNPEEPVIGFVTASTLQQKRLFIEGRTLPFPFIEVGYTNCDMDTIPNIKKNLSDTFANGALLPVFSIAGPLGITAYTFSYQNCVDCRAKGGTTQKPVFWQ
ncbi:DUF4249 domain-containing protein [Rhodocytophaga rosea]|uniref:DUF4249 domain-containing protein n=1 Tax=Rhodocytophaga rosea TaxID=2704465 RepID=A0A6C0GCI6_9BACT|nr:DUF4249 domain-containing protein [Rhodocytophaga rosea]QHT65542.1 DUF4249 domain-containing protein [Rhodocytophaga rosea]